MKKILFFFSTIIAFQLTAQTTFTDDFENYKVGDFVAKTNKAWTTWTNKPGTNEDTKISNEKAHGGLLSAKFISTATAGGPTDIVLPFFTTPLANTQDAGLLEHTMWYYVGKGKTAYFNYQAIAPVGKVWAMDCHFYEDGIFEVVSSGAGGIQGTTKYIQDQWVKVSTSIDMTNNVWSIKLDDKEVANFATDNNSLFAMNIYPTDNKALFYVDDVEVKFTPLNPSKLDIGVSKLSAKNRLLDGKKLKPGVTVRNIGKDTITSIDYSWTDGVNTFSENLKNLNILPTKYYSFTSPDTYTASAKTNKISFNVSKVNGKTDDVLSNNKKDILIDVIVPAQDKKVVAEQATGTWCMWCPRGHVFMEMMEREYPEYFIGIAAHGGSATEPMGYNEYTSSVVGTGYPSAWVDRKENLNPDLIEGAFFKRIVEPAHVKIQNKATYNSSKRELKIDVKTAFTNNVKSGVYRLMTIVLEDSIKGTTTAYNQSNAFANNAAGVMGGYEKLPNPVPFSKMVYQHVARKVVTDIQGDDLKADPKSGDEISKSFTYSVPAAHREKQLEIVSFVIDENGESVNATHISYKDFALTTSTKDLAEHDYFENMYPNPSSDVTFVDLNIKQSSNISIEVVDMNGRTVAQRDYGQMQGENLFPIQSSDFAAGIYMVRIHIGNEIITKKLVKEN